MLSYARTLSLAEKQEDTTKKLKKAIRPLKGKAKAEAIRRASMRPRYDVERAGE